MGKFLEKYPATRRFYRLGLWVISITLALLILIAASLQGVAVWLNSESGSQWLGKQLETVASSSGYKIDLAEFRLSGLSGLNARSLSISDEEGVFARASDVSVSINLFPLIYRTASMELEAETAFLERLPLSEEKNENEAADFQLKIPQRPDIFFNTIGVNIDVSKVSLGEQIIGGGLVSGLDFSHVISLEEEGAVTRGEVRLRAVNEEIFPEMLPDYFSYEGMAEWGATSLALSSFLIERENVYNIAGDGRYQDEGRYFDFNVEGELIKEFVSQLDKRIEFAATVEGSLNDFRGLANITGQVDNEPLQIVLPFRGNEDIINLFDLNGYAKGVSFNGDVVVSRQNYLADGAFSADFKDLTLLKAFVEVPDMTGQGCISLIFDHPEGVQRVYGELNMDRFQMGETVLNEAVVQAVPAKNNMMDIDISAKGVNKRPFSVQGQAMARLSPLELNLESLELTAGPGKIVAKGTANLEKIDTSVTLDNIQPRYMPFTEADMEGVRVDNGEINIKGPMNAPVITLDTDVTSSAYDEDIVANITGNIKNGQASFSFKGRGTGVREMEGNVGFPLGLSLQPFNLDFRPDAPLNGNVALDMNMSPVIQPHLGAGQTVTGTARANIVISGALNSPALSGSGSVSQARFEDQIRGLVLNDIEMALSFSGKTVNITSMRAEDNRNGILQGQAQADLSDIASPVLSGEFNADKMHFPASNEIDAILNADIRLQTDNGSYLVTGRIVPDNITVTLPDRFNQSIPELNIVETGDTAPPFMQKFRLNMQFVADNQIFVRGWGLDAEMGGRLDITGPVTTPDIRGKLGIIRGRYEEFGRSFDITRADLRFQGTVPPSPYLDILAETDVGELVAKIGITGAAKDPKLSFSSSPTRPKDEILSYILFGENPSDISPFQAIQLANTLRRFTTGGGTSFDPLDKLRNATGLDDLNVEGIGTEDASVGAGKYLSDNVYLELEQGAGVGSSAAKVEIELTPDITVESKTGSNGDTGAGIFWEWDY